LTEKQVSRRDWIKYVGGAVVGAAVAGGAYALYQSGQAPAGPPAPATVTQTAAPVTVTATGGPATTTAAPAMSLTDWLKEMGKKFSGTKLTMTSEATPPSRAFSSIAETEFTPFTGITVAWELTPLEHVLEKVTMDAATCTGMYDLYYLDQAWDARFANDTIDIRDVWKEKPELTIPDYRFDDFIPGMIEHNSMYKGKMVGPPCDCPIILCSYRKDVFEKEGLSFPKNLDEYMELVKKMTAKYAPEMYGTTGQQKGGHYSLYCDWTSIIGVYGQGGSQSRADGGCAYGDAESVAGLDYMTELKDQMPPGATTWDWSGCAESMAAGKAVILTLWGEFNPLYDTPEKSQVIDLVEAHIPPMADKIRPASDCGYDETPQICHQGGSKYAVARCSRNQEAAHVFLQWVTSWDVQLRGAIMGGGAAGVRYSTYTDPRALAEKTCRHFPVQLEAIEKWMSTEPHNPWQPEVADLVSHEIANWYGGKYKTSKAALDYMQSKIHEITGFRAG
jgi:multiple sugar transport system substrate-binding protein